MLCLQNELDVFFFRSFRFCLTLSTFGGGGTQQLGGVKQTTDFLDKSTWTLAIILIALIMLSNLTFDKGENRIESKALDSSELIEEPIPLDQLPAEIEPDTQ